MRNFCTRKRQEDGTYRAFYLFQEHVHEMPPEQAALTLEELNAYFAGRKVESIFLEPEAFDQLAAQRAVEFPALRKLFRPLQCLHGQSPRYGTLISNEDGEYCYPRSGFAPGGYVLLHTFDPASKHTVCQSFPTAHFTDPRPFFCLEADLAGIKHYDLFAELSTLQAWIQEELDNLRG